MLLQHLFKHFVDLKHIRLEWLNRDINTPHLVVRREYITLVNNLNQQDFAKFVVQCYQVTIHTFEGHTLPIVINTKAHFELYSYIHQFRLKVIVDEGC